MRDALVALELRGALRGRLPVGGAVAFAALAAAVTLLGLSAFRTVGLSQVTPAAIGLLNVAAEPASGEGYLEHGFGSTSRSMTPCGTFPISRASELSGTSYPGRDWAMGHFPMPDQ